jgi:hypothetical protein
MAIALAVVCGLIAVNFAALYRRSLRENLAVGEYAQFLLMNLDSYADQRRKFIEYLGTTGTKSSVERGVDAAKALARIARNMHPQLFLANAASRNAIARKEG